MTWTIHRAERTDTLAEGLAELLASPSDDPFATELVVVPARGVERWLSQRLAHRLGTADPAGSRGDGVCAGVAFRSPHSLVAEVLGTTDEDPWAPDGLVWPLLECMDEAMDEPWFATVATHLGHFDTGTEAELRRGRRHAVASRIARLFAGYAVQRPQLVTDWSDAAPGAPGGDSDGRGGRLDDDLAWQPELWRRLVERVDAPPPQARLAATIERLHDYPESFDLPPRLSLFGHTRIPESEVALLGALAGHRDVHLWLPHPSPQLWQALSGEPAGAVERALDDSHLRVTHPLLTTLGRDVRELQRLLGDTATTEHLAPTGPDPAEDGDNLLRWLQADLRDDVVRPAGRTLARDDRSIQVHACHGPARQVDVLRESLLALLEDDPSLEPRDILVMCPDIETYAPLITAAFGLGDVDASHPAHTLRVRLADRALTQTNGLLAVAARLLDLAGGRTTASDVLDLAQAEPVRSRFGFTDDDLATITDWVSEAGIRWGFDAEHREVFGLDGFVQNTWQFGIDRILTGVAVSADAQAWFGPTLPLDDVSSNGVGLAGRLAEYVARLRAAVDGLVGVKTLTEWIEALLAGTASLTRVGRDDAWQGGQMQRELTAVLRDAGERGTTRMRLPDVRSLLGRHLAGRPTRANFRTGTLTVCTMVPMRSVPHRVVCLLGLDDGVFPRFGLADGDDVLARRRFTGERDVRSEDRQLLLDAVLAATEHLVITYTGADEHTGQPRPPAVPLGELLDALDRTVEQVAVPPSSDPDEVVLARSRIVVEHPLQPFDSRNLVPGQLGGGPHPFTFDRTALVAARAAEGVRPELPGFLDQPLRVPLDDDVGLDDLLRFARHPVKGFFQALDVTLPWEADPVADAMPVDIDALESWAVGDRMLRDMMAGIHPDQARQLEWRRGTLPPGHLGWKVASEIREQAMGLAIEALTHSQIPARSIDIDVELPGGRHLGGTVPRVHGDRLVSVGYSRMGPKQMLQAWIQLLALSAADPDRNWTALVIARRATGKRPQTMLLGPLDERAPALLADLVDLRDEGRRRPLPLPLKASYAWAAASRTGGDPWREATFKWKSGKYDGEDADPAHQRVWGAHAPLEALLPELGELATRLWHPMLDSEKAGQ
ncbi:exodeoxyribonuclease V subunit gamma [Nocardioides sp. AE5]|uniref:exodeoxyribonuclease V subunit gamma n=1 Tax=Nocardioides sp. AE5 TaxID=2962573 RepID=UPI0028824155|nr:exodeoxyribonuclease V subunit gamma [Nocardioides sp. AE5]MDT0202524.1 exodeoxyribonuclease V subunit gamma [Nocardioides sp. AE5]